MLNQSFYFQCPEEKADSEVRSILFGLRIAPAQQSHHSQRQNSSESGSVKESGRCAFADFGASTYQLRLREIRYREKCAILFQAKGTAPL